MLLCDTHVTHILLLEFVHSYEALSFCLHHSFLDVRCLSACQHGRSLHGESLNLIHAPDEHELYLIG